MIDHDRLDNLIRLADPARTTPDAGKTMRAQAVRDRLLAAEPKHARRRPRKRWLWGTSALCVALVSGGGMAVAGDGMLTPWGWAADAVLPQEGGSFCYGGIRVDYTGVGSDAPIVRDAREIVRGMDITALDATDEEEVVREDYAHALDKNGVLSPVALSPEEVHQEALLRLIGDRLFAELKVKGYPSDPGPISLYGRWAPCGD